MNIFQLFPSAVGHKCSQKSNTVMKTDLSKKDLSVLLFHMCLFLLLIPTLQQNTSCLLSPLLNKPSLLLNDPSLK